MIFQALGVIFCVSGILFYFRPDIVAKAENWGQKLLFSDEGPLKQNKKTGFFFLLAAAFMFLCAYWVEKWNLSEFLRRLLF